MRMEWYRSKTKSYPIEDEDYSSGKFEPE